MTVAKFRYSNEKLTEVLKVQGRRMDWLSEQLDIDPSYVSHLKSGAKPITDDIAHRVARILGIPVSFLLADEQVVAATEGRHDAA